LVLLYKKQIKNFASKIPVNEHGISWSQIPYWNYLQNHLAENFISQTLTFSFLFFQSASHKTRYWISAFKVSLSFRLFKKSVWMTKSVREYLIDGYTDPLLSISNFLEPSSPFSTDKIGLIYQRNGSMAFDGVANINTGEDDLTKMGNINYFRNVNQTENFEAECGHVTGSLGDFYGAIPTREKPLHFFVAMLCR
jgi:hypothetical protein